MYHLNGFKGSDHSVRQFLATAALSSYPSESVLAELLTDDRLLRRASEFSQVMEDDLLYLESLPKLLCWVTRPFNW